MQRLHTARNIFLPAVVRESAAESPPVMAGVAQRAGNGCLSRVARIDGLTQFHGRDLFQVVLRPAVLLCGT
ncbi:MAG TPA: hypothetical protein VGO89_02210, partial [Streptomyces sp.]|nr:hypothetical protein [Streptomyces sp.]